MSALFLIQNFHPVTIHLSLLALVTLGLLHIATLQMAQPLMVDYLTYWMLVSVEMMISYQQGFSLLE